MESYCLSSKQARFPDKQAESDGCKKTGMMNGSFKERNRL